MDMYSNIELYIDSLKNSNYSNNTVISYEIHLRNYYSFCKQKSIDYKTITVKNMLLYKSLISEKYSYSSVNIKISVIKSFYNFLIDIEESTINPIRNSMYIRKNRKNPKPLTDDDYMLFISFIEQKGKHIELGYRLMFDTGIRISELVKLTKADILIIDNRGYLNIKESKNKKNRLVPIFESNLIHDLLRYADENYYGYLFNYSTRAYQLYAEEFTERFNIKFTTHMARHTFATRKVKEGMRIDLLKKILGHEDIRTTMYYVLTDDTEILNLGGTM